MWFKDNKPAEESCDSLFPDFKGTILTSLFRVIELQILKLNRMSDFWPQTKPLQIPINRTKPIHQINQNVLKSKFILLNWTQTEPALIAWNLSKLGLFTIFWIQLRYLNRTVWVRFHPFHHTYSFTYINWADTVRRIETSSLKFIECTTHNTNLFNIPLILPVFLEWKPVV